MKKHPLVWTALMIWGAGVVAMSSRWHPVVFSMMIAILIFVIGAIAIFNGWQGLKPDSRRILRRVRRSLPSNRHQGMRGVSPIDKAFESQAEARDEFRDRLKDRFDDEVPHQRIASG
jgi:hypothetical protein